MKKMKTLRNLLLAAFMLAAFGLSAQHWNSLGSNIYSTNSGNVGMGTFSPTEKLSLKSSDATFKLEDADGPGSSIIKDAYNASWSTLQISKFNSTGNSQISIDPSPGDGVSSAIFRFFRATNTTGDVGFYVHKGDGTGDINTAFRGNGDSYINVHGGMVGFGTDNPTDLYGFGAKIDVRGDILMRDANAFLQIENTSAGSNCGIVLSEQGAYTMWMWHDGGNDLLRLTADGGGYRNDLIIHSVSGDIGIGTSTTKTGYKLSVDGKIACEEVLVEDSGNWPDYVFEDGYELMSLEQVEESIEKNNHLPGMPTAAEVEENGVSLGEMQRIFLEKLEELTLYTIEQGKQLEEHQRIIEELQIENKKLRRQK